MIIMLEDLPEHLLNITQNQWKKLFGLIPEIEQAQYFGEIIFTDGVIYPASWAKITQKFHDCVYEIGLIVDFDWPQWEEGRHILSDEFADVSQYSAITLCKLLTAIIRSDRFIEGNLISYLKDGTILKIVRALEQQFAVSERISLAKHEK